MSRRPPLAGVLALSLCLGVASSVAAQTERSLEAAHRDVIRLLEGDPMTAKASHRLCDVLGLDEAEPAESAKAALHGADGCQITVGPDPSAVTTPFTEGRSKVLYESAATRERLDALLAELLELVDARSPSLEQKLMVHSTAWEISFGLIRSLANHPVRVEVVRPFVCQSLELLRATSFDPAEVDRFESQSESPLDSLLESLVDEEAGFVEVVPPTDLHADILLGRFTSRIFLAVADHQRQELLATLPNLERGYWGLREMPLEVPGVRTVLVLYFNVLGEDYSILPTARVAGWLEVGFKDTTSFQRPFEEAVELVDLKVIDSRWNNGARRQADRAVLYEEVDLNATARLTFLDVKPTVPDMPMTTVQASCLGCHLNKIATFDTRLERPVAFAAPFAREASDFVTPFYGGYEDDFRAWDRQCRGE